jgi:Ca2+-binding EF-hand superfamily protein
MKNSPNVIYNNLNNSFNNNNNTFLQASPVCNRVFTIKMMKEIINDIYNSKVEFDKKSDENKLPRETMEQHMYTYLNQKYGLKSIIIEWASNIINGIKIFSSEDSEICLFGKILRNEIEEDARLIYSRLQQSILEYLKYDFKSKNRYKLVKDVNKMIKEKNTKMLSEEEWKKIINYLYNNEDAKILEDKVNDVIQKKFYKNKLDTDRKLTREEIIQLSKLKEEYNIPLKDLVKILHEFQIKLREKYLKNFVFLFKNVDKDNNGIINEEEFVSLLYNMNIFGDQLKMKKVELLTQVDPYNNKQITFSECVNLFGNTPYYQEGSSNSNGSILDRICLGDNFST